LITLTTLRNDDVFVTSASVCVLCISGVVVSQLTKISKTPRNHKDNEKTCKWSTACSPAVDCKLLWHVESRKGAEQPCCRASTRVVVSGLNLWPSEMMKTLHHHHV